MQLCDSSRQRSLIRRLKFKSWTWLLVFRTMLISIGQTSSLRVECDTRSIFKWNRVRFSSPSFVTYPRQNNPMYPIFTYIWADEEGDCKQFAQDSITDDGNRYAKCSSPNVKSYETDSFKQFLSSVFLPLVCESGVLYSGLGLMVLFTNPSAKAGYDTRSIFKRSLTDFNSEFSFS